MRWFWLDRFTEFVSGSHATAVKCVSLAFDTNRVHALIGPSGCGKSTVLRTINRMHEFSELGWITRPS